MDNGRFWMRKSTQDACATSNTPMACGKVAHASSVSPEKALRNKSTQDACATFNPNAEIKITRRNLPHWYQDVAGYFITFRLADSIPQSKLLIWQRERETWLARHPEPRTDLQWQEYHRLFSDRFHQWLDSGRGNCLLGKPEYGLMMAEALQFFDGRRYHLGEWVVMPNHVHVIFQAIPPHTPRSILHSWKSFTAMRINRKEGTTGALWQRESYDHLVRSRRELFYFSTYIRNNPKKAGVPVRVIPRKFKDG